MDWRKNIPKPQEGLRPVLILVGFEQQIFHHCLKKPPPTVRKH